MQSLRRTLAVRFSATMFVALMLIGVAAFTGFRHILGRIIDRSLVSASQLESDDLAVGLALTKHTEASDPVAFTEGINRFVVVRNAAGAIVSTNTALADDLPLTDEAFMLALGGEAGWASERWAHGSLRSLYRPVPAGSQAGFAVIQVSASLSPLAAATRRMFWFTLATVGLATLATGIGAGWLARSSMAPVAEITAQAAAITPGTSTKRITAHADAVEFRGLVDVLNGMLDRLGRALSTQRRIIADVAHELSTPVTAMRGELEVALRSERSADSYRATIQSCLEETEHIGSINEALLLLARLEARHIRPEWIEVDMRELVGTAVASVRIADPDRSYHFEGEGDVEENAEALVDVGLTKLVVNRLFDNIIKHTPAGTHVRAAVLPNDNQVVVTVEDDGPGLPDDAMQHLFDRFYQVDPSRTRVAGAGLGLSIAAAVADVHDGSASATRSELGGLMISLCFPRRQSLA